MYNGKTRYAYVIHPNWENKFHALDITFIPRALFLRIANAPTEKLTEHQLYQQYAEVPWVKKLDAYRTFEKPKMSAVKKLAYTRLPQPDERGRSEVTSVDETEMS